MLQGIFFFIVFAVLGTIIRWKMAIPLLPSLNSEYLIHAHSHIAVLGWTNVAFMALLIFFTFSQDALKRTSLKVYFWALFIVNAGIAPSFTAQGYGPISITFSTLSVVLSFWFLFIYFRSQSRAEKTLPHHLFFTTGMLLYVLSAAGLVMVAMSMAAKIGGDDLFNAGVYFYLHSQYNGWMIFILIGSIYSYLHRKGVRPSKKAIVWQWALLTISFLPSYIPQISDIGLSEWLIAIGMIGTILNLVAIVLFLRTTVRTMLSHIDSKWLRLTYLYAMLAFLIKALLEVGGSLPGLTEMVHTNRQVVIGYLHLTLLAFISVYLIFAIQQYLFAEKKKGGLNALFFVPTTFLMVFILFFDGLLQWIGIYGNAITINIILGIISLLITIGGLVFFIETLRTKFSHQSEH